MFFGDGCRAALPAFAEFVQVGQHHVAQHGLHGELGKQPVQHVLRGRFVEVGQGAAERGSRSSQALPVRVRAGISVVGSGVLVESCPCRLGRGQSVREMGLHVADPVLVGRRVQPVPAGCALRFQQAVPALPGPEHVLTDAEAAAEFADAQHGRGLGCHDRHCTSM